MPGSVIAEQKIESDLRDAFQTRIETDDAFACRVWCALTNVDWVHPEVGNPELTFRDAGDLVACIRGGGTYADWYCCGPAGIVAPEIAEALTRRGWTLDGDVGEPDLA